MSDLIAEARASSAGRMDAYYYGFNRTGVGAIDDVLSSVAQAGKSFHNTEDWDDDELLGYSMVQRIQEAADHAADLVARLADEVERLQAIVDDVKALADSHIEHQTNRGGVIHCSMAQDELRSILARRAETSSLTATEGNPQDFPSWHKESQR